jgi:hypothetical protein
MTSGGRAEQRHQRRFAQFGDLGDRAHPQPVQLLRGHLPDAPQHPDGQRVQEGLLALGRDDEQPVRLRDAAGHLREELGAGDADRDRQPDPFGHVAPQPRGDLRRGARDASQTGHVQERLVDRDALDEW